MSTTYARRRVATRLTRSTSSKSKDGQDSTTISHSKSPSKSASPPSKAKQDGDIPVPQGSDANNQQDALSGSGSRTYSISSSASGQDIFTHEASHAYPASSSSAKDTTGNDFADPMSPSTRYSAAIYTPSRSTFSSSVSSKRKASGDIDPSSLRRSVRQRAEVSPFRLDSTEAQRDSTLFISQPQTPSKLSGMGRSPTNRKDSLFMSLPASFNDNGSHGDAQYAPIFDLSLLSANSSASCFLPMDGQAKAPTTTPDQEPPLAGFSDLSPAFDLLQYNDFISPFPPTPQPAFLNFPPTPTRFSGTFSIAPQSLVGTPSSASFSMPLRAANLQKVPYSPVVPNQHSVDDVPKTPLNPTRPLPRRARRSSACSSNAGSIIVKDIEDDDSDEEHEDEEGDATAQPVDAHHRDQEQEQNEEDDERFALFASQVRRKAEAMSLKSSQGAGVTSSPAPGTFHSQTTHDMATGGVPSSWSSDISPNKAVYDGQQGCFDSSTEDPGRSNGGEDHGAGASLVLAAKQDQIDLLNLPPMPEPLPPMPVKYRIENNIYTDQYSSFPLSEDVGMGVSPNKAEKPKRGHHNKNRGDKPPRPRNCFILYRSDKVEEIRRQTARDKMQKDISKIVADLWRNEPQSVKDEYARRADIEREEHLIKYPGYVYQPTRKDKPTDEEVSPLKRSGSARSKNGSDLSRSAPASRASYPRFTSTEEEEEASDTDERSKSPSPTKAASRARTPLKQSRIPVPMSVNRANTYSSPVKTVPSTPARQLSIPVSTQRPAQSARKANAIAQNAANFATQRGLGQSQPRTMPASAQMSKSRSTPSAYSASSVAQTPSAPRYAQPTAASMSKSLSQPMPAVDQPVRSTPVHPPHQYAAYGHIQHPMPQDPLQTGLLQNGLFSDNMTSTPVDQQRMVFPDISLDADSQSHTKSSAVRPQHQRSQTFQPALNGGTACETPSRIPSMRRTKTTSPQPKSSNKDSAPAIPNGFVIGGKLYPYEDVEEAMKAFQATKGGRSSTRIASSHSTSSNGPVQELMMPASQMYPQQVQQMQMPMQYLAQPGQNYVIGVAADGQQIPLLLSQPQSMQIFQPWQSVPAFMPSSTQATPSTGYAYDFPQSADPLKQYDFNNLYTPNTATSNMSNMPLSGTNWFPQMSPENQETNASQYFITNDPTLGGTSPTFYLDDANGQQQIYTLAGPTISVDVDNNNGFAPLQDVLQPQWTST